MQVELEIGRRQHGVITTAQLTAAGVGRSAIATRMSRGTLRRAHRGLYLVGPIDAPRAREAAAILACGPGAVLSHRSAAAMWGLVAPSGDIVDVTVPGTGRSRPGVRVHRTGSIDARVIRRLEGLSVTSPARTLLDLATCCERRELEHAVEEAQVLRLVGRAPLGKVASGSRPGAAVLRATLARHDQPRLTRSDAERRLLELVREAGLPEPATNAPLGPFEVDALWRAHRLVLEVDGWAAHGTRAGFERDRRRDAHLQLAGYRVLRVTWRRLVGEPLSVAAMLGAALTARTPA